ncbi:hypothetical protein ACFWZ2_28705 [Streptomyces sp. NPDC059002]|uniref:hypothetical protein n=1 Tax=Streptomyces sp. NPDC059002 TaxID=3346690 RepID=UPI0036A77072
MTSQVQRSAACGSRSRGRVQLWHAELTSLLTEARGERDADFLARATPAGDGIAEDQ